MLNPEKLWNARKAKKLSQRELGAMAGVSGAIIGLYEKGIRRPRGRTLENLAKALDMTIDQLCTEEDAYANEYKIRFDAVMKLLEFLDNPQNERKVLNYWSELCIALTELQRVTNNSASDNLSEEQELENLRRTKLLAKTVSDCFTNLQKVAPENYAHIKSSLSTWQQEKQQFDALLTEYLKLNTAGRKIIKSAATALAVSDMTAKTPL